MTKITASIVCFGKLTILEQKRDKDKRTCRKKYIDTDKELAKSVKIEMLRLFKVVFVSEAEKEN